MSGLKNPGSIWIVNGKTVSDGWQLSKIAYRMILSQIIKKFSRNWFFGWTILFQCSQNLCTAQLLLDIKLKCMHLKKVSHARCMSQFKASWHWLNFKTFMKNFWWYLLQYHPRIWIGLIITDWRKLELKIFTHFSLVALYELRSL